MIFPQSWSLLHPKFLLTYSTWNLQRSSLLPLRHVSRSSRWQQPRSLWSWRGVLHLHSLRICTPLARSTARLLEESWHILPIIQRAAIPRVMLQCLVISRMRGLYTPSRYVHSVIIGYILRIDLNILLGPCWCASLGWRLLFRSTRLEPTALVFSQVQIYTKQSFEDQEVKINTPTIFH